MINAQRLSGDGGSVVFPSSYDQLEVNKSTTGRIPNVIVLNPEKTPTVEPQRKRKLTIEEGSDGSSYTHNVQSVSQEALHMPDHRFSIIPPPQEASVQSTPTKVRGPPPAPRSEQARRELLKKSMDQGQATSTERRGPPPPAGRNSSSATRDPLAPPRGPPPRALGIEGIKAKEIEAAARQEAARRLQLDPETRRRDQENERIDEESKKYAAKQGENAPPEIPGGSLPKAKYGTGTSAQKEASQPNLLVPSSSQSQGTPPRIQAPTGSTVSTQQPQEELTLPQRLRLMPLRGPLSDVELEEINKGVAGRQEEARRARAKKEKEIVDDAAAKAEAKAKAIKQEDDRRKQERLNSLSSPTDKERLNAAAAESASTAEKGKIREKESELMIKELGKKTSPSLQQTAAGQPKLASKGSASDILRIKESLLKSSSSGKV